MEDGLEYDRSGSGARISPFVADGYVEDLATNDLCRSYTNVLTLTGDDDASIAEGSNGGDQPRPPSLTWVVQGDGQHRLSCENENGENVDHRSATTSPKVEMTLAATSNSDQMPNDDMDDVMQILDVDLIAKGLSNMGKCADGTGLVYLHLTLPGYNLPDVEMLMNYVHVQKVEIPYNKISDLSPLGYMCSLLEVDASHNLIKDLLDFEPPRNLKTVNLSFNRIQLMTDLSAHHYLKTLILDNNQIEEINGLQSCQRLSHLSLAHNKIQVIQGMDNLPIKHLNLAYNALKKIEGLETLKFLQTIDLSGNQIRSMDGLQNHHFLESIELADNEIIDLSEVEKVKRLSLLRRLSLQRNPVQEMPDFRLAILFHLQQLLELDRSRTDVDEKVSALNMFNPPLEVLAARDHTMNVVYSFLQPSRILDSTLPSVETPYPILVLVGPQGTGKKDLAMKLVEEFPDYFGYAISHTTRAPKTNEVPEKDYHFISVDEFEQGIKMGKFLQTFAHGGNMYGLTIDSVEAVAREGLACVVHLELEGVLTLKNTYFEPRYVLTMPLTYESHEQRLRSRNVYTEQQIAWTLGRVELYASYNREHPGFFDMIISSDSITESYRKLCHLVTDYLGISVSTPSISELEATNTELTLQAEPTQDTLPSGGTSAQLARAWSRPSAGRDRSAPLRQRAGASAPARSTCRGSIEEASIKRRVSVAKEVVCGAMPTIFDQLTNRSAQTVPQLVSAQQHLADDGGDDASRHKRSVSAPAAHMDALPPNSPDSSEMTRKSDSGLSNISEAGDLEGSSGGRGADGWSGAGVGDLGLPDAENERITVFTGGSPTKQPSPASPAPPGATADRDDGARAYASPVKRAKTSPDVESSRSSRISKEELIEMTTAACSQRSASQMSAGRPGSERHPVLPPIIHAS